VNVLGQVQNFVLGNFGTRASRSIDDQEPTPSAVLHLNKKIPGIDGLRGIAILFVVATHLHFLESGFFGVDLFFVISGFLITTLLLQEAECTGSIDLRQFYLRRAARILPAMAAVILVVYTFNLQCDVKNPNANNGKEALGAIFFYLNWLHAFGAPVSCLVHLWSLSIEEQFYLVWPGVLSVLACVVRSRSNLLLGIVIGLGILGPEVGRTLLWPSTWTNIHYYRTDLRFDALCWGALVAWGGARSIILRTLIATYSTPAAVLGVAVLAFHGLFLTDPWRRYYLAYGAYTAVAASSAILVSCVAFAQPRLLVKALEFSILRWIGVVSYGLYLWHPVVMLLHWHLWSISFLTPFSVPDLAKKLVDFALSCAVAAVSFYFWERPFIRLKRYFRPRTGRKALVYAPRAP
jgi:peptidoglycan/LPS O-acetylase OafA/YrhL